MEGSAESVSHENAGLNGSLAKVAKGTIYVMVGLGTSLVLGLGMRVLFTRTLTPGEVGILYYSLMVIMIPTAFGQLGMGEGLARYIGYLSEKDRDDKIARASSFVFTVTLILSAFIVLLLFLISPLIESTTAFRSEGFLTALWVMIISFPFMSLRTMLVSLTRGHKETFPRVMFSDILPSFITIILYLMVLYFDKNFYWAVGTVSLGNVLATAFLFMHVRKKHPRGVRFSLQFGPLEKSLLLFSLPLMGQGVANLIVTRAHVIILGFFRPENVIGIYSTVFQMAQYSTLLTMAFGFIYVPVVSGLFASGDLKSVRRSYAVITKWLFAVITPLFFMLFLFPRQVIFLLFGPEYLPGASVLRVMALVSLPLSFLGPGLYTLIAVGRSRSVFWASAIYAGLNLVLCFGLIPLLGMMGAGIAFLVSVTVFRALLLYMLKGEGKPFTKTNLKMFIGTYLLAGLLLTFPSQLAAPSHWWWAFIGPVLAFGCVLAVMYLGKGVEREDLYLARKVVDKTGLPVEKWFRKLKR